MNAPLPQWLQASVFDQYRAGGLAMCLIGPNSKKAVDPAWNENPLPDGFELPDGCGLGLLHVPSRTCAIDVDSFREALIWLKEQGIDLQALLEAPEAVRISSGRDGSAKLLYRLPDGCNPMASRKLIYETPERIRKVHLELRCATAEGKSVQDILPVPTHRHPVTCKAYEWVGDWRMLPVLPAALLELWLNLNAERDTVALQVNTSDVSIEELDDMLSHVDPDSDRDTWRNIGMGIKSKLDEAGYESWNKWSRLSIDKYPGEPVMHQQWRSFKSDGGVTFGTVVHHAIEGGWVRPLPEVSEMFSAVESISDRELSVSGMRLAQLSDIGNGLMFAQAMRGRFLYVSDRKRWLRWDDSRWIWCSPEQVMHTATKVADCILDKATEAFKSGDDGAEKQLRHAVASRSQSRLEAMIALAKSRPEMHIPSTAMLDSNDMQLGVRNGVVDLNTGTLLAPNPDMLITHSCNASFDRTAECPLWLKFLDEIFLGDVATIETIQRAMGYTLTGMNREEVMLFCIGFGSNGKSVFNNVTIEIIGDYAAMAPPSLMVCRQAGDASPRTELANLAGVRMVSVNELQSDDRLDEQVVKMLAGSEAITTRHLYGEFFTYKPKFTPWVRSNHKPIVYGDDDGIWRRVVLIPFEKKFDEDEKDPALGEKLLLERDGILMWMLDGVKKYLAEGLKLSPKIRNSSMQYRTDSDLLGTFLLECCAVDGMAETFASDFFRIYQRWCHDNGIRGMSKKSLTRKLAERGIRHVRSNSISRYIGIRMT